MLELANDIIATGRIDIMIRAAIVAAMPIVALAIATGIACERIANRPKPRRNRSR